MDKIIVSDTLDRLFTNNIDRASFNLISSHKLAYMGEVHNLIKRGIERFPSDNIGIFREENRDSGIDMFIDIIMAFPQYICLFIYRQLPSAFGVDAIKFNGIINESNSRRVFIYSVENIIKYASSDETLLKNNTDYAREFCLHNHEYVKTLILTNNCVKTLSYIELADFAHSGANNDVVDFLRDIFRYNVKISDALM